MEQQDLNTIKNKWLELGYTWEECCKDVITLKNKKLNKEISFYTDGLSYEVTEINSLDTQVINYQEHQLISLLINRNWKS